jgi:dipeptidyl aminopeptidase/acylaminoacyl peptidase
LIGQTVSHYRVTAALGAGGMGEVYRATDTALGREVAIKVLPPEVAQDHERLARFEREAKLLAALNHPNIAAIYGLEQADGKPFLALELVEGEDLRERLSRGAIPVEEALEIAKQIAEALGEAHAKGIVHRDLKPANVKVTPDGKVKVLDFGLAKAWGGDLGASASSAELSQSPTLARTGTLAGVILGTAAYMSPEQASGKAVDKRADIWAFGVVLFEMLSGRSLFTGETASEVMASVIKEEPAWDRLPASCPLPIAKLLRRCLRKRSRERLQDIGDARIEIQDVLSGPSLETQAPAGDADAARLRERRSRARERWIWAAALVAAAVLSALAAARLEKAPEPRPPAHVLIDTPEELVFWNWSAVAVSPDGRHVAFAGTVPGSGRHIWIRSLASPDARPLPGTREAIGGFFWSPDSASIAFVADNELRKISIADGTVQRICLRPEGSYLDGVWGADGTIVIAAGGSAAIGSRLYTVSGAGGDATPLTTLDEPRAEQGHLWPQILPDGRILFRITARDAANSGLFVISRDAPAERRRVRPEAVRFQYVAPGYLLFARDGVLFAQGFDARELQTRGDAIPIASSVAAIGTGVEYGWFSASSTGRAAWLSAPSNSVRLEWLDRRGGRVGALGEPGRYSQIALSPDDRRVVAEIVDANNQYDLWLIDVARGVSTRLTTDATNDRDPVWSPDGKEIVYTSSAGGEQDLLRKGLSGSGPGEPLSGGVGRTVGDRDIAKDWVGDGNTLLYLTIGAERTLWARSLDGPGPAVPLLKGFLIDRPDVSPDGRWLAYISRESGPYEVYVTPFGRPGERVRVSTEGGMQPRWRGDAKELFYLSPEGALMAVDMGVRGTELEVGLPKTLAPAGDFRALVQGPDYSDYAVTANGQRFLVRRPADPNARQRLHVMLDWPSLVK